MSDIPSSELVRPWRGPVLTNRAGLRANRSQERGIVLLVAIVVVIAMTLGAYAMLRSAGNSLAIAGNVSFQQNATSVADLGTEAARAWTLNQFSAVTTPGGGTLAVNGTALEVDQAGAGYFASWNTAFDPTAAGAWDDSAEVPLTADQQRSLGVTEVRYVIHRMCSQVGSPTAAGQQCVVPEGICVQDPGITGSSVFNDCALQPFFRVTSRVDGPRNTRSYTQVLLFF